MSLDFYLEETKPCEVFSRNITHNLGKMAKAAGIYKTLWHPEENGIKTGKDAVPSLQAGLAALESDPEKFKKYNSPNGWGRYEHFVPFVRACLEACESNPDATVRASI